jgi:hypothetical protein
VRLSCIASAQAGFFAAFGASRITGGWRQRSWSTSVLNRLRSTVLAIAS